jgi:hypothetical protein
VLLSRLKGKRAGGSRFAWVVGTGAAQGEKKRITSLDAQIIQRQRKASVSRKQEERLRELQHIHSASFGRVVHETSPGGARSVGEFVENVPLCGNDPIDSRPILLIDVRSGVGCGLAHTNIFDCSIVNPPAALRCLSSPFPARSPAPPH